MSKRTRKAADGKSLVVTARDNVYVGLDVHKVTIHAAVPFTSDFGLSALDSPVPSH